MKDHAELIKVGTGKRIAIASELIVGRQADCGVLLVEGKPSRRHAKLGTSPSGPWVEDLGSANGTFVNNTRIQARTLLRSGDRLRFDIEEFEVFVPSAVGQEDGKTQLRSDSPVVDATGSAGQKKPPPAWVFQDAPKGKTQFISPEDIQKMMNEGPTPDVAGRSFAEPHLEILSGSRAGTFVRLLAGEADSNEWTIGSDDDRDIQIKDKGVSGVHAKLVTAGGKWRLSDQMAANGTYVNNRRTTMSFLNPGDRIRFGSVECVFHGPGKLPKAASTGTSPKRTWLVALAAFVITLIVLAAVYMFWRGA